MLPQQQSAWLLGRLLRLIANFIVHFAWPGFLIMMRRLRKSVIILPLIICSPSCLIRSLSVTTKSIPKILYWLAKYSNPTQWLVYARKCIGKLYLLNVVLLLGTCWWYEVNILPQHSSLFIYIEKKCIQNSNRHSSPHERTILNYGAVQCWCMRVACIWAS